VLALLSNGSVYEKVGGVAAVAESAWRETELVEPLLRVLEAEQQDAHASAIAILAEIPGALRGREGLLQRHRNDLVPATRAAVVRALRSSEVDDGVAVGFATSALRDREDSVRLAAVQTLEELGARARSAFPVVLEVMQHDEDETVRYLAGRALHVLGPGPASAIPKLMEALNHEDDDVAAAAASALGAIGAAATMAEPLLLTMAREDRYSRRSDAATEALITIMGEAYWRRHLASD
jgi:HEAT repeat protein